MMESHSQAKQYRQWIREFYQENKLINDQLYIRGRKVDLGQITANVLNIAGKRDNIANPKQVEPLMNKISSKDKTYHLMDTGHVSIVVGRKANNELYPLVDNWLTTRSK